MCMTASRTLAAGALMAVVSLPATASADPAGFYKDRTVSIVVAAGAGGGYTFYARLLAEFMASKIPGSPNIIIQNMPGAGGIKAANYMAAVAPKDGATLGMVLKHTPMAQVLGTQGVRYDATKFQWLGNMDENQGVLSVLNTAPATTIEDAMKTEVVMASTGRGSETYINPAVLNHVLGTRFKIVAGYPGAADMDLAIERGEAHGRGCAWAGWKILKPDWIASGRLVNLVQIGLRKDPELPNVPLLSDLARTDEERQIFDFLALPNVMARAFFVPAETPEDRVQALRVAFDRTVEDRAFLAEAQKRNIAIEPRDGTDVQKLVTKFIDTPSSVVKRVQEALGTDRQSGNWHMPATEFRHAETSCVFAPVHG